MPPQLSGGLPGSMPLRVAVDDDANVGQGHDEMALRAHAHDLRVVVEHLGTVEPGDACLGERRQ